MITYPDFGKALMSGKKYYITWETNGLIDKVNIEYSVDSAATWNLLANAINNQGYYEWTTPTANSNNCFIRISNSQNQNVSMRSERFSIVPQHIIFLSPVANDSFIAGNDYYITWRTSGGLSNVDIQYSIDNGASWQSIGSNVQNTGSYKWSIPLLTFNSAIVKISNPLAAFVNSISDTFYISPPIFAYTSPILGASWNNGRPYYISWNMFGDMGTINIDFSADGGTTWSQIATNTQNAGYYLWNIPDTLTSQDCRIRVQSSGNGNVYYISDSFSIANVSVKERNAKTHPNAMFFDMNSTNPVSRTLLLRFGLPQRTHVEISVYDIQGRVIRELVDRVLGAGYYTTQLSVSDLKKGTYLIIAHIGNKKITKKIEKF